MNKKCVKLLWLAIILVGLVIFTGCSKSPGDGNTGGRDNAPNTQFSQTEKEEQLKAEGAFHITWSPDGKKVVYVLPGQEANNGKDLAYFWQAGDAEAKLIREVSPTTHGFVWSPNSQYFVISEKLGERAQNSIINAETLKEEAYKFKSVALPVWSPDSKALVFANEQHDYGDSWGSLEIYRLGEKEKEYIWYAKDYFYIVKSWDNEGNIHYVERDPQGKETEKSTKNIKPSISGVHLGDSMDQVRAVLGGDYQEIPPGEEWGHFPEPVYRWDYEKGYRIYFGANSGGVLEIIATSPEATTNLGVKMGDSAEKVFATYRPHYIEPESIHGGKLYGIFKVEGAAALNFVFDLDPTKYRDEIKPNNKVTMIILTYPSHMDDSF